MHLSLQCSLHPIFLCTIYQLCNVQGYKLECCLTYVNQTKELESVPVLLEKLEDLPALSYLRAIPGYDDLQATATHVSTQLRHWLKTGESTDVLSPVPVR